jgi:hypothetical protein
MDATSTSSNREFLERPLDPGFVALYELWLKKRGLRLMPSRGDFDPSEFPRLLPHVELYDVGPGEGVYKARLMGSALVDMIGRDNTGKPPGHGLPEGVAKSVVAVLDAVVARRAPIFLRGRVLWIAGKKQRKFEACALPLSEDDLRVNIVFSALKLL